MIALRLAKPYRGYRAGEVIQATPRLAEYLTAEGIAVREAERPLLAPEAVERAVGRPAATETR